MGNGYLVSWLLKLTASFSSQCWSPVRCSPLSSPFEPFQKSQCTLHYDTPSTTRLPQPRAGNAIRGSACPADSALLRCSQGRADSSLSFSLYSTEGKSGGTLNLFTLREGKKSLFLPFIQYIMEKTEFV